MEGNELILTVAGLGMLFGMIIGAVAQKTHFCTMGAVSDVVFMQDWARMRSWLLAIAVALGVTQWLHYISVIDIYQGIYLGIGFRWASHIVGGVLFGYGMTMAGGCGNKTLVRLGAGNLKSLVVLLVMGVVAYMTQRGLSGLLRAQLESATSIDLGQYGLSSQGIPDILSLLTGLDAATIRLSITVFLVLALLWFCFKDREFRAHPKLIVGGVIIGLVVPAAWYVTGVVGFDDFEPLPVRAVSFVAPAGDGLQYLMTFTGSTITFSIALAAGVLAGAFLAALLSRELALEAFTDASDMSRHLVGAALMGFGGIVAVGCTFGQGISGNSTLSLGSLLTFASILFGAVWGLKSLEEDGVMAGLMATLRRRG